MNSYEKSQHLLKRALRSIPLGAQTFSKSPTHFPEGVSPHFAERAEGAFLWDVDGNRYLDMASSLAAINLGYGVARVNEAVKRQVDKGSIFSLSHELESEVAERIIGMVPCAEKVRFGKNGSDGTSGCVRAARAFTGRDHVVVCGYHGWHDWYIAATTRNRGVPVDVQKLTHSFVYNDISSLEELFDMHPGKIACVVMEAMNLRWPKEGFLAEVKELCHEHGALLVFDETITGFRFSNGGAQELFGVTPDLASFGKGLANGYPLSAIAGREDVMKVFEEVFFSFTYGGETLSLAAACEVLDILREEEVLSVIRSRGQRLIQDVQSLVDDFELGEHLEIDGHPSWSFLVFKDKGEQHWQLKTLFMQECFKRGVLSLFTHNLTRAHGEAELNQLLRAYREIFELMSDAIKSNKLKERIHGKILAPLFKVR